MDTARVFFTTRAPTISSPVAGGSGGTGAMLQRTWERRANKRLLAQRES
jgi:hypothetical protein